MFQFQDNSISQENYDQKHIFKMNSLFPQGRNKNMSSAFHSKDWSSMFKSFLRKNLCYVRSLKFWIQMLSTEWKIDITLSVIWLLIFFRQLNLTINKQKIYIYKNLGIKTLKKLNPSTMYIQENTDSHHCRLVNRG